MKITKNPSNNRFDIEGIPESNSKKIGINGYHGVLGCIIGWIAAKILHKAVPIKTSQGVFYLNCKSLENWFRRMTPGSIAMDSEFSKKMHDPDAIEKLIESLKKPTQVQKAEEKPLMQKVEKKAQLQEVEKKTPVQVVEKKEQTPTDLWNRLEIAKLFNNIDYLEHNRDYHRFPDIKCPTKTAIFVDDQSLHANRIGEGIDSKFHLIASQAPLFGNEPLFWNFIFSNEYSILDLTTPQDVQGGVTQYYPEKLNKTFQAGPYLIKLMEKEGLLRKYQVTFQNKSKEVNRFHYTDWKDFGEGSLQILTELVEVLEKNPSMLVHCRAGVGRTGTLITAALLKEKIENGKITKENYGDSLVDLLTSLREDRGVGFVQNFGQFKMVHQYGMSQLGD